MGKNFRTSSVRKLIFSCWLGFLWSGCQRSCICPNSRIGSVASTEWLGTKTEYNSCAARCVSPGIDSTPVLLSWIVLVWLSPLDFLSHRTSDIAPARASSPAYSRSPVCPSRCHGGRTLLGNGYSVVMRRKNSSLIPTFRGRFVNPHR